jgi:Phosphohistidine phosphatase SixA
MAHLLLLLRHGKSSWDDLSLADRDRPLARRGRRAAERMGEHLRTAGPRPDLVVCSSSRRTRETLERLSLDRPEIRLEDAVYGATDNELRTLVRDLPKTVGSILLIGHNPALEELAVWLCGQEVSGEAEQMREKFPTGALAVFEIDGAWRGLASNHAHLVSFRTPRELG